MKPARFSRVALAIALLFSLSAGLVQFAPVAVAQTASTHELAKVTPDDALLYVDLTLDTKSDQWQQAAKVIDALGGTSSAKSAETMAADEGIEGGQGALVITNLAAVSGAASQVGAAVEGSGAGPTSGGFASILQGAANATPTGSESQSAGQGVVLILKPTDMEKAWSSIKTSIASDSTSATPTETTYKGVTISTYEATEGETAGSIAQVGDYIVWAETEVDVQAIVDVAKGDHKPLSDVANFAKGAAALPGTGLAFGFLNGQTIADQITNAAESSSSMSEISSITGALSDSIGRLVGADRDTAFEINAKSNGIGVETVELPIAGSSAPAATASPAAILDAASKVPANSLVFVNGYNLGKTAVMEALGLTLVTVLSNVSSGAAATPVATPSVEDMYAQTAGFLGFNLQKDFLDQLTGQYALALWTSGESDSTVNAVLASDATNPASLQVSVSGLGFLIQAVGSGKAAVTTVDFGSDALSEVTLGSGSSATKVDFGVASKQFILGVNDGAKTYLSGVSSSLADSSEFKDAFAGLPSDVNGMAYVNVAGLNSLSSSASESILGATPVAGMAAAEAGASKVKSYAMVSYEKDGLTHTSSQLLIENP